MFFSSQLDVDRECCWLIYRDTVRHQPSFVTSISAFHEKDQMTPNPRYLCETQRKSRACLIQFTDISNTEKLCPQNVSDNRYFVRLGDFYPSSDSADLKVTNGFANACKRNSGRKFFNGKSVREEKQAIHQVNWSERPSQEISLPAPTLRLSTTKRCPSASLLKILTKFHQFSRRRHIVRPRSKLFDYRLCKQYALNCLKYIIQHALHIIRVGISAERVS